jgi:rubrerythrin
MDDFETYLVSFWLVIFCAAISYFGTGWLIKNFKAQRLEKAWKQAYCHHCGNTFLAKNWHTPMSCPLCHWSRGENHE